MKVRQALISVSDKTGLEDLAKGLSGLGVKIISTGGTAKFISSLGIEVVDVSTHTGFPEMLDGRVKSLHPKIHGGLLALRNNPDHMKQLQDNDITPIDMVVVNLYPFEKTISKKDVTLEEAIENIDIGGPTMLRSAAKNYKSVAVLSSPSQYASVLDDLEKDDCSLSEATLMGLAVEVFNNTSCYDGIITEFLTDFTRDEEEDSAMSENINLDISKVRDLRYGENPHQKASFYRDRNGTIPSIADAEQLQGKELSFNNILDLDAALKMVKEFSEPSVSIVKHNNPCGVATATSIQEAYIDALACDRMSAFGSIMAFNKLIDSETAKLILDEADFVECIIAPGFDDNALDVFSVKKNLRVLCIRPDAFGVTEKIDYKKVAGGWLLQDSDNSDVSCDELKIVTKVKPNEEDIASLQFAWKIVKHVKSNAIVLTRGTATVGIGAGQMSRVDSVRIAVQKAGDRATGAIMASDAFFPKVDSIEEAHKAGVKAVIQPGGSIKDKEVIEACDQLGIPMICTGVRHFRH